MAERFSFSHVEAIAGADLRACMCPMCMGAKGPCKVKQIIDIKKNLDRAHPTNPPNSNKDFNFWGVFQFCIFYPKWPWIYPPTSKLFLAVWNFFNFATSFSLYHTCNKANPRLYIYI